MSGPSDSFVVVTVETDLWGTLTAPTEPTSIVPNVTQLERWCSAWGDLLASVMALNERTKLDDSQPSNMFIRRALWESAIASYGRCAVSGEKRKIMFNALVEETVGEAGMKVHERIMDWRHGHVAHRNRPEFESAETVLVYADGPARPTSLNVVVTVHAGPLNSDPFLAEVENHVRIVRDAVWEKKMFPLAVDVVEDLNAGRLAWPKELRIPDDQVSAGHYVIDQCITSLGVEVRTN